MELTTSGLERAPCIGLVYRSLSPPDKAWSRIPAGLALGLREFGFDARLINAQPGRLLTRGAKLWAAVVRGNRHGGLYAPEMLKLYRLTARARAHSISLQSIVQMGSDFYIPFDRPFVTYEDMTVPQLAALDRLPELMGATAIERWIESQARCYDAATSCCVASQWAAESIISDYGVDPSKIEIVGFGRNYEPRPLARDWTRPRFLFMGYDWERKNGPAVLGAFAQLRERFPHARLDVAGGHPEIAMDGVMTHGSLDFSDPSDRARAEALFENATCFVMPSKFEPFGMVYVEAAAAGVPSIGTTVGGARDVIGQAAGLLVDPSDQRALAAAMATLCDPEVASRMGSAALERSRHFTWRAVAERILHVLEPSWHVERASWRSRGRHQ